MPDIRDVHIDVPLSNLSIGYRNDAYVGGVVFPEVKVGRESDKFFKYDKSNLVIEPALRAVGAEALEVDYDVATDQYAADERALRKLVPDRVRNNSDTPLDADRDATLILTDKLALVHENDCATLATDTAQFSATHYTTLSGTSQWSDFANSDPMYDFEAARDAIQGDALKLPTDVVIPWQVWIKIRHHPAFLSRIQYTQTAVMTTDLLAQLWEVKRVTIAAAIKNTAPKGIAASLSRVWGKHILVFYSEEAPTIWSTCFAKTFRVFRRVKRWREEKRDGDMLEVGDNYSLKIVDSNCGYLFRNVIP